MNVKEFVSAIKAYMKAMGWQTAGFDGQWALLRKNVRNSNGELPAPLPLPDAVIEELNNSCVMWPFIELFLTQHGWTHYTKARSGTAPTFHRIIDSEGHIENATLPTAFRKQIEETIFGD